jgi:transcriptional regulator with XRE-family HTH domain
MRRSALKSRLARARVIAGLSQEEFSKLSGIPIDPLRHYERGKRVMGVAPTFMAVMQLGVSGAWLEGNGSEDEPVAWDGTPFTREKYLEHARRRDSIHLDSKNPDPELNKETRALLARRVEAWRLYLHGLIDSAFIGESLEYELLGLELTEAIQVFFRRFSRLQFRPQCQSVDEVASGLNKGPVQSGKKPGRKRRKA